MGLIWISSYIMSYFPDPRCLFLPFCRRKTAESQRLVLATAGKHIIDLHFQVTDPHRDFTVDCTRELQRESFSCVLHPWHSKKVLHQNKRRDYAVLAGYRAPNTFLVAQTCRRVADKHFFIPVHNGWVCIEQDEMMNKVLHSVLSIKDVFM